MARTPFGPTWDDLNLEALGAFFALGEEETLTWECKGGEVGSKHISRAVCGFANSNRGGYLVLGVSGGPSRGGWILDGWTPPTEARVYVGQVIADGVAPMPPFDIQTWPLPSGREITVVEVGKVAVPPAITSSGGVYERLPGQTRQVSDPTTLRRLFERGEEASGRASKQAVAGMSDLLDPGVNGRSGTIVVSLASPSLPGDISLSLFRKSVTDLIVALLAGSLRADSAPPVQYAPGILSDVSQHAITLWNGRSEGYGVRVGRHGSCAVSWSESGESGLRITANTPDRVEKLWKAAAAIAAKVGGAGEAHVCIGLADAQRGSTTITRITEVRGPSAEELQSIVREANRALGRMEFENE